MSAYHGPGGWNNPDMVSLKTGTTCQLTMDLEAGITQICLPWWRLNNPDMVSLKKYNMSAYHGPGGFIIQMSAYHGPGCWNNPDMASLKDWYNMSVTMDLEAENGISKDLQHIVVGNFGFSPDQEKVHFGMWCIFAAPLLLANDLRSINNRSKALLINKRLLAINQDPLGIQGKPIQMGDVQVWTKPILPKGSKAVAVVYTVQGGNFIRVKYPLEFYGLDAGDYHLTEVFEGHDLGQHNKSSIISFTVNPTGIYMFTAKPVN
ncbi:NAGA [Mytilus edulis]|uniref:alpha-galactosidase n=1 Tax=Mytilus edulis TaxID=6550 RepID=A0A8S3SQ91_MYTED|nr:NAGA [Mytilus edulis]